MKRWVVALLVAVLGMADLFAQAQVYTGHASVEEGISYEKAMDIARYNAIRKLAEFYGVEISSESVTEDFALKYDRIKTKVAERTLKGIQVVYENWDPNVPKCVVVVIIHNATSEVEDVKKKLSDVNEKMSDIRKKEEEIQR